MVSKFLLALVVGFGATSLLLYTMNKNLAEKNASLEQALKTQNALLQETQAELQLRDEVIKKRDAELAEAALKAEAQESKYARLVRTKKAVQDWDAVCLPDDVIGMLKAGPDRQDRAAGGTNNGGGNP